ncbi:TIGR01621 family pseudouridine synthase [Oceanospirillum sanctuarii]|uniref:TIGR01621 family pseudouridine synthase n=1 Tax=Oceanospirillum sanctuarii TaxID=1434821 RepID=UPI0015949FDD|nr:TIGR01621 family pseudouridine synthase [Oceanospirillum sanctuarii]
MSKQAAPNFETTDFETTDFETTDFTLIEQNADYVIIAKAPGVDVHRDGDQAGITEKVSQALGVEKLYLVHRLDKVTSGLMVLAKRADVCAQLAELFKAREVSKFYLAVSAKKPKKKQGWIIGDMERSRRGSWKLTSGKQNPAVTQFFSKPLQPGFRAFLLKPRTGKTHQLRVALKSIGAPICGDSLYDDAEAALKEARTYLHAYGLSFNWQGELKQYRIWPTQGEHYCSEVFLALKAEWGEPEDLPWPKS